MVSAINPLLPEDGVPAVKADLRANLLAAKAEIEALQAGGASGYMRNLAGAVSRTLGQLAIDQGLNVKEFGALGDGSGTTIQQWLSGANHDRGYASLAAIQADFPHAQALSDTIDWVVLQRCCDLAAGTTVKASRVYMPAGTYVINRTLQVTRGNSVFATATLEGEGTYDGGMAGTIINASSFLNAPAIAVSGARQVELRGFHVVGGNTAPVSANTSIDTEANFVTGGCTTGQFNPYVGIAIDPYAGPQPASPYPLAAGESYNRNFYSHQVILSRVSVRQFVVGVAQSPSNNDFQGDFLWLYNCNIEYCAYGFSSGGTQNRDLIIVGGFIGYCREMITNFRFGNRKGNFPICIGMGGVEAYRIFYATPRWNSGYMLGGRFESIQEIGRWYEVSGVQSPLTLQGIDFTLGDPGQGSRYAGIHLRTSAPVRFIGCSIGIGWNDSPAPGMFNIAGAAAGEVDFDSCFLYGGISDWPDQLYIGCQRDVGAVPRVNLHACNFWIGNKFGGDWDWGLGTNPVGMNSNEKRRFSLPARLQLTNHSQRIETNTAPYWIQIGNTNPDPSTTSGYNHGTARQLTFTAGTPSYFVAQNAGASIAGDILFWRHAGTQAEVPMLRVTSVVGSTITCEKLFADAEYDTGYAPSAIDFCPRQWAPATTLTGTTVGSSVNVTMNQSGVVRAGDWITDGTNVRRVVAASGTSATLNEAVTWSGTSVYWARLRQFTLT